ncbi:N-acetylmuramoyl-L-alanine amidase [Lacrimispora sp.]|uniref:N-acetylmuramoyl-L-alanine amidase n=1 Tax=Lacrimispora sp. TaxID=2719234 RepID=UPI00345F38A1
MKLKRWEPFMAVLLLVLVYIISSRAGKMAAGISVKTGKEKPVVVIDAGHGGNDPGKIGVDGSLEKDINLQIAKRLQKYLEASDVEVILTRKDDNGLYSEKDSRKKVADMNKRCEIINKAKPALTVSIHQNSYHQEEVYGGQVFYYKRSEKGKKLAEILQKRFDYVLGEKNTRLAKPNDNYYLLLHVKTPIVIVECGFLTNWKEAALLNTEDYQDRMAWTIHMGIMEYLNGR